MEKQKSALNGHREVLKNLDMLEEKLNVILNFYEELGILRQRRQHLVETLMYIDLDESFQKKETVKKQVTFCKSFLENKRSTRIENKEEKKKSAAQIYDLLKNMSSLHLQVNQKISDIKLMKTQNQSDPEYLELDNILAQLQEEKDQLEDEIIQFVIRNVVEGKEELFQIISGLEEENIEMEETINLMEKRISFLKDTVIALMLENQLLKRGQGLRTSDVVRKSVIENASLILPDRLRKTTDSDDVDVYKSGSFEIEQFFREEMDLRSDGETTTDSFALDAPLATWKTDEDSTLKQVRRISRDFQEMEVTQMKLNLLKRHVQRHGAKYINRNTLIDPSKGMSLWHH